MPQFNIMRPPRQPALVSEPTRQDAAIVVCGGGDPFADFAKAKELCAQAKRNITIFAGNDMIEMMPDDITHAVSLHPEKFTMWLPRRKAKGFNEPERIWAHRNYHSVVTHWTRDWAGSTGLFCAKVAREMGFVHILLCGVPMTVEADHFVRKQPWVNALGFQRGWAAHVIEIKPYLRSYGGWTKELLGEPTEQWLRSNIEDKHSVQRAGVGQKA